MLTGVPAAFATALVALAVWADLASACSCADRDERDRLEDGDDAIVGRVLEERSLDDSGLRHAFRVRVDRGVGVRVRGEVEVRVRFEDCGSLYVGRRQGMFVRRRPWGWVTDGCSIVAGDALDRALEPYDRPLGAGRAALLAGGRFGDARVMALDLRGRVIGYGRGRGQTHRISVCPGAGRAAELVVDGRAMRVALRDLGSLDVVRSARLPVRADPLDPSSGWLSCADADGAAIHVAVADYIQRTRFDRVRILRVDAAGVHRVATLEGSQAAVGPTAAYVSRFGDAIVAVDLATGATGRLTGAGEPDGLALGPDAARLALYDARTLRVVDVATGRQRTRRSSYGTLAWLDSERVLFRKGGTAVVYDAQLHRIRRYAFVRMLHQAHVAGRLFGTDGYRLRSLSLATGRRRGVRELPDRGIFDLVAVPGRPRIEPGRYRPRRVRTAAAGGASRCR